MSAGPLLVRRARPTTQNGRSSSSCGGASSIGGGPKSRGASYAGEAPPLERGRGAADVADAPDEEP